MINMKDYKFTKIFFLFIFIITACNNLPVSKQQYILYLENPNNNLRKKAIVADIEYTIQLKTQEYIKIKENNESNKSLNLNLLTGSDEIFWFNIFMSSKEGKENVLKYNVESLNQYNERINYFMINAEKSITLKVKNKECEKIGYYFQNNYGIANYDVMIVGFKIDKNMDYSTLDFEYVDLLFKSGPIKFKFHKNDIDKLPTVQL
jgi:hypothetical protein